MFATAAPIQLQQPRHVVQRASALGVSTRQQPFVVFNEQQTLSPRFPALANRAVIIKIDPLFRF